MRWYIKTKKDTSWWTSKMLSALPEIGEHFKALFRQLSNALPSHLVYYMLNKRSSSYYATA